MQEEDWQFDGSKLLCKARIPQKIKKSDKRSTFVVVIFKEWFHEGVEELLACCGQWQWWLEREREIARANPTIEREREVEGMREDITLGLEIRALGLMTKSG